MEVDLWESEVVQLDTNMSQPCRKKKTARRSAFFKPTRMSKGSLSMRVAWRLQDSVRDAFKVAQCLYTQPHKIYSHVHALMFGFPVYLTPVLTLFPSDKP